MQNSILLWLKHNHVESISFNMNQYINGVWNVFFLNYNANNRILDVANMAELEKKCKIYNIEFSISFRTNQ